MYMKQLFIALLLLPLFTLAQPAPGSKVTIRGSAGGGTTVNGLTITTGEIWPRANSSYKIEPSKSGEKAIEIFNIGNGFNTGAAAHNVPTGIGKNNWSMLQIFNAKLDSVAGKWVYGVSTVPQCMTEQGLEGVTLHAVPAGTNFSDTWHEQFQVRAEGVDGTTGITTGVYNQSKTTMYFKYKSGTYSSDSDPWTGGSSTAENPFIWLHSEEIKGTNGDFLRIEQNSSNATGGRLYFKKSRGTYASKTTSSSGDNAGVIVFSLYDGADYQNTARILTSADAAATSGVAPQSLLLQTSATNSAGIATRMKITGAGYITYETQNTPSSSSDATQPSKSFWFDDSYIYYKTSTGTIKRIALTTF